MEEQLQTLESTPVQVAVREDHFDNEVLKQQITIVGSEALLSQVMREQTHSVAEEMEAQNQILRDFM